LFCFLDVENICQLQAICNNSGSVFKSKDTLQVVVNHYLSQKEAAISVYGLMNCWDVSAITDMSNLFYTKTSMNEYIGCWDVSKVTTMDYMFYGAIYFNQDVGQWDVSNVTKMDYMFCGTSSFNQDIGQWNVTKVLSMNGMFYGANSFSQDISSWNIRQVKDFSYMFYYATKFKQNLCDWFSSFSNETPVAYSMFTYSSCVFQVDPTFVTKEHFCQKCEPPNERRGMFI